MTKPVVSFGPFTLDRGDRRLTRDGVPVDLNARYFDALALLTDNQGQLVTKDRFLDEVWRGVPVTDEALTQCIKMLRRALGDDAARPALHRDRAQAWLSLRRGGRRGGHWRRPRLVAHRIGTSTFLLAGAGTIGGGMAGLAGGLVYGIAGVSRASGGELSVLLGGRLPQHPCRADRRRRRGGRDCAWIARAGGPAVARSCSAARSVG